MDQITKNKIIKALELSLQIKGSTFYHMPTCGCIRVYTIVNDNIVFEVGCYDYNTKSLFETLERKILENE